MASWDGVVVMMGDFNEVRNARERHGLNFNDRHAKIFNNFIDGTSLIDVPLGGYNFTWTDKWGSKMSTLDRFLVSNNFHDSFPQATGVVLEKGTPDHRPILLKELKVDYGLTSFKFFHFWLEMEGFKDLVEQTWKNDGIINDCKMTHQALLSSINVKLDLGTANEDDFRIRKESLKILGDLERVELANVSQKDGNWIEDPSIVKSEFLGHFMARFQQSEGIIPVLDSNYISSISHGQRDLLERLFSRDEIKLAVWDCGGDKAPGPDGFSFKFFTFFWDLVENDVVNFVHEFFHTSLFPQGCNLSFIALIPKVPNAKTVFEFHPISLIRCQYKIIGKLLANRIRIVIGDCVNPVQSAFIKGRNILDGPLILNEVISWYRNSKKT
nr:hypothetical protein [Tanacetum cinerariifolium]